MIDDSELTPGFIAPAATVERPYERIDDNELILSCGCVAIVDKPYDTIDESNCISLLLASAAPIRHHVLLNAKKDTEP
jgi:hypothetical protein